ncbi:MAG: peptidoglycan DD-metalloendopeptidase family protein [Sinobacteraceae bacterium]|nr:peptidoglycan DD-metalloendopeptidase family protein [Nevskiaceae bacterium]
MGRGAPPRAAQWLGLALLCAALSAAQTVAAPRHPEPRHRNGRSENAHRAENARRPGDARRTETEAELQAIKAEIERVSRQVSGEQVERDRQTRELRNAEVAVGHARGDLEAVRRGRADKVARRNALAAQRRAREADLAASRETLAAQLRAAYQIGREEPLKLLLNQKDPERAGRMFVYYSYFGRARAQQIQQIETEVQSIAQLDDELISQDEKLADLERQQQEELGLLEQARQQRSAVLASLTAESNSHAQSLERLKNQQAALEKLLRELREATEKFPLDNREAFAQLRGKLAWPVSGTVLARYGETRAGGVKWDGVLVGTERGAAVRAVYAGRVIYADWLPGLGLLTIIDHGDGYMSLYGHNERLYKAVGEHVNAGDALAAAGDSGGSSRPELYFEIRKAGKAVDPAPWFKARQP